MPILLLLLCFFLCFPVLAEEIPVNIKAENLKFIEGTSLMVASGSVEVKLEGLTIQADRIMMDSETNLTTAEGHVRIFAAEYQATADTMLYDANRDTTRFKNFSTCTAAEKVQGLLYLSVADLEDIKTKQLGRQGEVTTCDKGMPHYYLLADRVTFYPHDRIEGWNATAFVGELPVFWLPYIYYDFGKEWKRNWVFGHNDVEGDYIKSSWGIPLGLLYLDLMQKKGFGYGIETTYDWLGSGVLYLYHLDEQDTGISDWITRLHHTQQITPQTKFTLDQNYSVSYLIPSGRRDQTNWGFGLDYKGQSNWTTALNLFDDRSSNYHRYTARITQQYEKVSSSYDWSYELFTNNPGRYIDTSHRLYLQRPLWNDRTTMSLRANYYDVVQSPGGVGDERLEPLLDITGSEKDFSWRLAGNWYFDIDNDKFTADNTFQYLEKKPEIEISPNPIDLRLFRLTSKVGGGRYHEVRYVDALKGNRDFSADRGQISLGANQSFTLPAGTTMPIDLGIDQFCYSPGDQLYAYRESLALNTELRNCFRNNLTCRKGGTEGNTPFLFDQLGTRYDEITDQMQFYYLDKLNWAISGGHNWQAHRWMDVMTTLRMTPNEKISFNSQAGWDIENRLYKDWVNNLSINPFNFLAIAFSTVSNINSGDLRSGSVGYDLFVLKGEPNQWRFKVNQVYDPASRDFRVRDIMIKKELHCWDLQYTYNDYRKEFSVIFSIKAFPDEPFGLAPGRGFYIDGVEREIQNAMGTIKQEGAVTRY